MFYFDLLSREFAKVKKKNLAMRDLEEVIQQKLDKMLSANPNRINYYERYQQIIDDYNREQDRATIEKTFLDHWTDKQETKAAVDNLIRDTLWAELPECYSADSISIYRQQIYEYVYTRYRSVA